jgi:hypothetical protein
MPATGMDRKRAGVGVGQELKKVIVVLVIV